MTAVRVACLVLSLALLAPVDASAALSPARQRTREAKSYYCYYGPDRFDQLAQYDLVILHTPAATAELVRQLKSRGVVTIGYSTCGEDESIRTGDGTGPGGRASWYFDKDRNNQPDMHPVWKSPFANAADPKWRNDRVREARRLVEEVGFDGIFLDTVDDVSIYPETFDGMVQLINAFRTGLPDAPIIMNQSWKLMGKVAPALDGVMLEGFSTSYDFENKRYRRNPSTWDDDGLAKVQQYVVPLRKKHPFQVFVLDYAESDAGEMIQAAKDRAATFGFLHCIAPVELDAIYEIDRKITGIADAKWWQKQTTPADITVTLDTARNGFPAGTKVVPSGCFLGYTVAPIVDGLDDRAGLHWSKVAWASPEDGEPAWLEIELPAARVGGGIQIEWQDGHPSRDFVVQSKASDRHQWETAASVRDNAQPKNEFRLPRQPYQFIRIHQPAGGGSKERPNLMWVARIGLLLHVE